MYGAINILNSIKSATARSMAQSMYVNSKYAAIRNGMQNDVDMSLNEPEYVDLRGIQCGYSQCWESYASAELSGEICIEKDDLDEL